jgi:hypothetical protein
MSKQSAICVDWQAWRDQSSEPPPSTHVGELIRTNDDDAEFPNEDRH